MSLERQSCNKVILYDYGVLIPVSLFQICISKHPSQNNLNSEDKNKGRKSRVELLFKHDEGRYKEKDSEKLMNRRKKTSLN